MTAALLAANRRTFASLRKHRNYRLFFVGQVISTSGTWMQNIATAWLVLAISGSPVAVGVLAVFQFLPFTLLGLFAGVLVDRFDARRTRPAASSRSTWFDTAGAETPSSAASSPIPIPGRDFTWWSSAACPPVMPRGASSRRS